MFPNIPRAYIVRELDRADGVSAVAVDNLLLIASDYADLVESTTSLNSSTSASNPTSHNEILKSLTAEDEDRSNKDTGDKDKDISSSEITKKNWDKIDSKTRHRILSEKKKEMLLKARESFISQTRK